MYKLKETFIVMAASLLLTVSFSALAAGKNKVGKWTESI